MAALVTPTSKVPFHNLVTSSSSLSSSISSSPPRANTGRTIRLLLSLAVACCLLASSTSTLVAATPVPKVAHHQHQQRSLLQQVHHVQIADESVHNSIVLMKKSIQKRKQQQQKQKGSQQQQRAVHPKKLQKRKQSEEVPSTAFAATVDSRPADDLSHNARSSSGSETVKRSGGSKVHEISRRSEHSEGSPSSTTSHKNKKRQGHAKASRAKLISAYEAIVFSESQLPVFWSHDHAGRQQQTVTKKPQKQRPKAANLESKASEAKLSANRGQGHKKSKTPVAGHNVDSSLELKAPMRGNGGAGEGQGHGQGVAESDKNRRATVEVVPVSVTADAQEQLGVDEPREHLLPQQAKRATTNAQDGSSPRHGRQYAPEGFSAFLDNGCRSSSAMMISGAIAALLLVSYRIYKRTQRQRQMAVLASPLDLPPLKTPLSSSVL
ncbi:hypothetical protein EC968_008934 [Mortierella alpina]|nr:hypothetical protein EC968_008934 [Mortierella alpina]